MTDIEVLEREIARIERAAEKAQRAVEKEIAQLRNKITLLQLGPDFVKSSKLASLAAEVAELKNRAEDDFYREAYEQRQAMRARGEEIEIPEDVAGMKTLLAREAAAQESKGR
jgi:hypothetical protein